MGIRIRFVVLVLGSVAVAALAVAAVQFMDGPGIPLATPTVHRSLITDLLPESEPTPTASEMPTDTETISEGPTLSAWQDYMSARVDLAEAAQRVALLVPESDAQAFLNRERTWRDSVTHVACGVPEQSDSSGDPEIRCATHELSQRVSVLTDRYLLLLNQQAALPSTVGSTEMVPDSTNPEPAAKVSARTEPVLAPRVAPERDQAQPQTTDEVDQPAVRLSGPGPVYPPKMQTVGMNGLVRLRFVVGTNGRAEASSIQVISSTNREFDAAAIKTIRESIFRPAMIRGHAVRQLVEQAVGFSLSG